MSDSIDEQIRLEKQRLRGEKNVVKVLLLGQSESGKSTTLKRTSSPSSSPPLSSSALTYHTHRVPAFA